MENCEKLLQQIANNTAQTKQNTELIANILKAFYKLIGGKDYE